MLIVLRNCKSSLGNEGRKFICLCHKAERSVALLILTFGKYVRAPFHLRKSAFLFEGAYAIYPFCKKFYTKGKEKQMKKISKSLITLSLLLISLLLTFSLFSCSEPIESDELWKDATYTENKSFGEGAKTITVNVVAGEKQVVFTIKTDAETLGDALLAHSLIEGSEGQYGLYVEKVNGIKADYNANQSYWSLKKGDTALMTGVDGTAISDGEEYSLVYTR